MFSSHSLWPSGLVCRLKLTSEARIHLNIRSLSHTIRFPAELTYAWTKRKTWLGYSNKLFHLSVKLIKWVCVKLCGSLLSPTIVILLCFHPDKTNTDLFNTNSFKVRLRSVSSCDVEVTLLLLFYNFNECKGCLNKVNIKSCSGEPLGNLVFEKMFHLFIKLNVVTKKTKGERNRCMFMLQCFVINLPKTFPMSLK